MHLQQTFHLLMCHSFRPQPAEACLLLYMSKCGHQQQELCDPNSSQSTLILIPKQQASMGDCSVQFEHKKLLCRFLKDCMCHGESGQPAILKGESPLEVFFLSRCLEAAVESACIRARKVVIGLGGVITSVGFSFECPGQAKQVLLAQKME